MGANHSHKEPACENCQPWASPALIGILVIGAVFAALFAYLAYYGWLTTPDKPWQMMR
jgi:hypothetical protein